MSSAGKLCGTPGCILLDRHCGVCSSWEVSTARPKRLPAGFWVAPTKRVRSSAGAGGSSSTVEEAEGYKLHLSPDTPTGYVGVYRVSSGFQAKHEDEYLGTFETAVAAAVAVAKAAIRPSTLP